MNLKNAQAYPIAGRMPIFTKENRDLIRRNIKTQTRRVMKPQPDEVWETPGNGFVHPSTGEIVAGLQYGLEVQPAVSPYGQAGDIRVMPEPLKGVSNPMGFDKYDTETYYADDMTKCRHAMWGDWKVKTLSSLFMPVKYGRTLVRYTRIWVERLQDISAKDAMAEGVAKAQKPINRMTIEALGDSSSTGLAAIEDYAILWDSINAAPKPVRVKGVLTHYVSYPWEAIRETREHRGKPWFVIGNPFNWCIEWELLSTEVLR